MEEGKKKKKDVQRTFLQLHVKKSQHQPSFLLLPSFCIDFVPKNFLFLLSGKTKHQAVHVFPNSHMNVNQSPIRLPVWFFQHFQPENGLYIFSKSDKWMLGFAICNQKSFISFSHFTTVAIRKQSRSHICQLLLGLWRRRKWEDICKIIFIVGFEL